MKRCEGCGAVIQTAHPMQKGFIRNDVLRRRGNDFYCERCYNLIHYNRLLPIALETTEIKQYIDIIAASKALVVNVVDVFDLEGSYIPQLNHYFPKNPILLVANKFDLFLPSVKISKITNYLHEFIAEKGLTVDKSVVMAARIDKDLKLLLNLIRSLQNRKEVYFFGMTNVGKSTLINGLIKIAKGDPGKITASSTVGTTLDFIKVDLSDELAIIDMPGIINSRQAIYYLNHNNQKMLIPKNYVRPKVYQLNPGQTIFIGGFCIIKFIIGEPSSFILYVPNGLKVHRTKLENTDNFYSLHCDDILKIPNLEERKRLGLFAKYELAFGPEKRDITFSGLGFMTLVGSGKVEILCYEPIKVGFRKAII